MKYRDKDLFVTFPQKLGWALTLAWALKHIFMVQPKP